MKDKTFPNNRQRESRPQARNEMLGLSGNNLKASNSSVAKTGCVAAKTSLGGKDANRSGLPGWISEDLVAQTIEFWTPYADGEFGPNDAINILLIVSKLLEMTAEQHVAVKRTFRNETVSRTRKSQ